MNAMPKKLFVIGGVSVDSKEQKVLSRSFAKILQTYSKQFEVVAYLGPDVAQAHNKFLWDGNKQIYPLPSMPRSFVGNISYFLHLGRIRRTVKAAIEDYKPDLIQIRIPAILPLLCWGVVKKSRIPVTSYVAGDWGKAFTNKYKFFGNALIANLLENWQKGVINNSIVVTAGDALSKTISNQVPAYSYFSTTHSKITRINREVCRPKLITIGRLEGGKRVIDALDTLCILLDKKIPATLTIIGDGPDRENIETIIGNRQIGHAVDLVGYVSSAEVLETYYTNADILVHPSVAEGTPKVLPEAMSFGVVPIAVRDVGSINTIITDKKNGLLVMPHSPSLIADAIQLLLNDNELYRKLVENCYVYASYHTIEKEVEGMFSYIKSKMK